MGDNCKNSRRLPNIDMLVFCSWSWLCAVWSHCIIRNQKRLGIQNIATQMLGFNKAKTVWPCPCFDWQHCWSAKLNKFIQNINVYLFQNLWNWFWKKKKTCKFGRNQVIVFVQSIPKFCEKCRHQKYHHELANRKQTTKRTYDQLNKQTNKQTNTSTKTKSKQNRPNNSTTNRNNQPTNQPKTSTKNTLCSWIFSRHCSIEIDITVLFSKENVRDETEKRKSKAVQDLFVAIFLSTSVAATGVSTINWILHKNTTKMKLSKTCNNQ